MIAFQLANFSQGVTVRYFSDNVRAERTTRTRYVILLYTLPYYDKNENEMKVTYNQSSQKSALNHTECVNDSRKQ